MKCVRCPATGTVPVHQVDAGNMQGPDAGPRTGVVMACNLHAEEIGREPGAWPWLAPQEDGTTPELHLVQTVFVRRPRR